MTPEVVAQLHPPRLPQAFTALGPADLLAAFGAGLVLAALVLVVAAPLLRRRPRRLRPAERIAAAATLPPQDRQLALLRLLAEGGGTLPDDLRAAVYAGRADPARIEALILGGGRR
ncbi:MAG: hypothetical protein QM656_16705 [Paracoccaceae bacterium]